MIRHLCISVFFVDSLFHGKREHDEPEWPPSPMRLFQALIAGARAGCRNGEWSEIKTEAFRWLARCQPPLIVAPESRSACAYSLYVPNNDSDKEAERSERLTTKTVHPQYLLRGATLHYLWSIDE